MDVANVAKCALQIIRHLSSFSDVTRWCQSVATEKAVVCSCSSMVAILSNLSIPFITDRNKEMLKTSKLHPVITFVMKMENLPFPLAVKKLLKEKKNISLTENELQSTPEEEEKYKKKESMRIINAKLCAFFFEEIQKDTPVAKLARES